MSEATKAPANRGALRVVNALGLVVLGMLGLAAYEAGSPVDVWREPRWVHAELRPRTRAEVERPLEVQVEIQRFYQRPGVLLPHLAPLEARPDLEVVVIDLADGELASRRTVVDAEAGSTWDPARKPAVKAYPPPPGAADLLATGAGTWPLGDGLAIRVTRAKDTFEVDLLRDGAAPVHLHTLDVARGQVPTSVLQRQMAATVSRR